MFFQGEVSTIFSGITHPFCSSCQGAGLPKRRLSYSGLHGVMSCVADIFVTTATITVRTSSAVYFIVKSSQSHITTDSQSVSVSWCLAQSGTFDQRFFFFSKVRSCLCGAPSMTRGRVSQYLFILYVPVAPFSVTGYQRLPVVFNGLDFETV
jgi:hypothetical protein